MAKQDDVAAFVAAMKKPMRCKVCKLPAETRDEVKRLRLTLVYGEPVAYQRISDFLRERRETSVCTGAIRNHLTRCEGLS